MSEKSEIAKKEEEILEFWQDNKIFEKSLEKTKDGKPFVFYDGPPFATGTPHYGHLVASAMKDAIPRYQTMKGRFVERQWGWDCHGLPIENIVEKELGIKSKKEIEEMGIGKFNKLCREKIFTYVDVWNKFIPRFGRWAEMENPYQTMDASYMESEWWAFKKLYDQGLIYKDYRSMHICPRCETTLAQAEVAEGYKDIKDIAVTAKFELVDEPGTFVLAWTTTPWTLPGNVALAVGEDVDYVLNEDGFIFAKSLIDKIPEISKKIKKEFKGKELIGKSYKPLFDDFYKDKNLENRENGWKIYGGDFVTTEDGTGVVHIAPAFGEDDMNLGKENKLPFIQHLGMDGIIKNVQGLSGLSVKPKDDHQRTDIEILKILVGKNLLFSKEKYEHSYPHCWRCETPLLNYATSSWFVSVTKIKKELLKHAENVDWTPSHIKKGRWLDWLSNARDWSISRQRFWANTIPVWENEETGERLVIGSREDLKKYSKKSGNKYLVIRHGGAKSNEENYHDSGKDKNNHVTEEGKKGVLESAENLKTQKIDLIISSDILRAKETAEILSEKLNVEIIYDKRLREKDFGDLDGMPLEEYSKHFSHELEKFEKKCPGGESRNDVRKRLGEFIYEIEEKYQEKNILFVSHGSPIYLLESVVHGMNEKEIVEKLSYPKNAEVRNLDFVKLPHNEFYELDLHRPYVDEIELFDENGKTYKRVTDVLDTWFDSGSVPFSSYHYPFENKEVVERRVPADFIAEGLDQVSKWFYYQHVLAGGIFKSHAFNNVIVNGIVLAEDGKKMAKRLQNYPDPREVLDKYGADTLRFYLLSSSVVQAENLNFSEAGADEIYKKIILRLQNIASFYEMYGSKEVGSPETKNVLDEWILALLKELSKNVTRAMDNFELNTSSRYFIDFIDEFSTWYIRRSRDRFKSEDGEDRLNAILTTRYVLLELSKLMAPFTPFIAEDLYKRAGGEKESVHLEDWPESQIKVGFLSKLFSSKNKEEKPLILKEMSEVRKAVSLGLEARAKAGIKVRQPLSSLKLQASNFKLQEELLDLIKDEVNVKEVVFDKNLGEEVELDVNITPELKEEGDAREFIRQVQEMRKKAGLKPSDLVVLKIEKLPDFIEKYKGEIKKVCGLEEIKEGGNNGEEIKVGDFSMKLEIVK